MLLLDSIGKVNSGQYGTFHVSLIMSMCVREMRLDLCIIGQYIN